MESPDVIDLIHQALRAFNSPAINDVSFDGDNDSCEIILTTDDGEQKQDWVISSSMIRETDRDYDETPA
jgi:hypothetical protein